MEEGKGKRGGKRGDGSQGDGRFALPVRVVGSSPLAVLVGSQTEGRACQGSQWEPAPACHTFQALQAQTQAPGSNLSQ